MAKDNKVYNINGKAYGERLDTFTEVYAVRSNESDYDTPSHNPEFYAVHHRVSLANGRFNETMILLDAEAFDGGVFDTVTDLNDIGWDLKTIDIVIRDLVMKLFDDDEVFDLIEYERCGLYRCDKAMLYYGKKVEVA